MIARVKRVAPFHQLKFFDMIAHSGFEQLNLPLCEYVLPAKLENWLKNKFRFFLSDSEKKASNTIQNQDQTQHYFVSFEQNLSVKAEKSVKPVKSVNHDPVPPLFPKECPKINENFLI